LDLSQETNPGNLTSNTNQLILGERNGRVPKTSPVEQCTLKHPSFFWPRPGRGRLASRTSPWKPLPLGSLIAHCSQPNHGRHNCYRGLDPDLRSTDQHVAPLFLPSTSRCASIFVNDAWRAQVMTHSLNADHAIIVFDQLHRSQHAMQNSVGLSATFLSTDFECTPNPCWPELQGRIV